MPRSRNDLYSTTGPGIDSPPVYEHPGQAESRALTAALRAAKRDEDGTWYARDAKDNPVAYSTCERGVVRSYKVRP